MTIPNDDRRGVLIEAMETIERLEERLRAAEGARQEPIAVVGIGCRLPGGVDGADAYWRLLAEGRDAVVDVPADRWDHERFLGDDPDVPGTIRARAAGFLTHWRPDQFDAAFFGIAPREAAAMDPQQRLLLEVAWEALEHAGLPADGLRGSRTGVFTGVTLHEYAVRQLRHLGPEDVDGYTVTSCLPNYASGRVSYFFGFTGPSVAVDAACASSLVTVHLACQSLRSGESALALAAGTNLMLMPETSISMTRWGALAPDGRCKAFDAAADGLGRGEGCGVVVLKRLADARRDGDRVLAVIRGTAVNQDGASTNFTAPNGLAQEAVIRTALDRSGLTPEDIDYVEAHGTGTALGDPIELEALAAVFGDREAPAPLMVGSAKTNIGHVEAAAGVAGLIKTVLALHHGRIPPHLHFREMTPRIGRRAAQLAIPADGADWPHADRPARAGVSAFGVSGTNAHVVLEAYAQPAPGASGAAAERHRPAAQAPGTAPDASVTVPGASVMASGRPGVASDAPGVASEAAGVASALPGPVSEAPGVAPESPGTAPAPPGAAPADTGRAAGPRLFPVYAAGPQALSLAAERLADWLETEGGDAALEDVGHSLALRRTPLPERLVVLARDRGELVAGLRAHTAGAACAHTFSGRARSETDALWVFSGFGSQWAGMGRELLTTETAFAETVDLLEPVMAAEGGFSLREALRSGDFGGVSRSQPVIYALQVGLAAVWRSYGLRPAAVLGHSMGEVAAAVTAGALGPEDGARVMCRRSRLLAEHLAGRGGMALVELPADEVTAHLVRHPEITVAVHASPRSTVVAGPEAALDTLVADLERQGLMARRVKGASGAGHSPQVDPVMPLIRDALADIVPGEPAVPVYGTALDDPRKSPAFDAEYWASNARNPVRFTAAVAAAAEDDHRLFLEVSPHPVVTQSVSEILTAAGLTDVHVSGSLRRDKPERETLLGALAGLHAHGVPADWAGLQPHGTLVTLPANPWQHESHWYTSVGGGRSLRTGEHPLLGIGVRIPGPPLQHAWRSRLDTGRLPWLADHRSEDTAVMPGTAYCEMALAAAAEAFGAEPADVVLRDVEYLRLLTLAEPAEVVTVLTEETPGSGLVEIMTRDEAGEWTRHARARAHRGGEGERPRHDPGVLTGRYTLRSDAAGLYSRLREAGQHHGPAFAGVTEVALCAADDDSALATLALAERSRVGARGLHVHPALLDSAMQVLGAVPAAAAATARDDADTGGVLLPDRIGSLRVWGDPGTGVLCRAEVTPPDPDAPDGTALLGHVHLLDASGAAVVEARDIRLVWLRATEDAAAGHTRLFHEPVWQPAPSPAPSAATGTWLLLPESADEPLAVEVRTRLGDHACRTVSGTAPEEIRAAAADPALRGAVLLLPSAEEDAALRERDPEAALERAQDRVARLLGLAAALATAERPGAPPRLWVAARGAQAVADGDTVSPEQAALRGLLRTLGWEHPELRAGLVDLGTAPPSRAAEDLITELAADTPEEEVAHRDGTRLVARMTPAPKALTPPLRCPRGGHAAFRLESTDPGDLDSVRPVLRERRTPGEGEVEIRVEAAGLNFSDVLKAMGWYRLPEDDRRELHLGGECAGVVSAVGPGVEGLAVGDRVVAIAFHSFASHAVTRRELVVPLPGNLTPEAAAALPTAYGTAWYGLVEAGRLEPGERVLVHAASGGVGLAAVAVARARGARVYATAGSEAKRQFLRDLGVEHVMDSRSLDWAAQLRAVTGGRGVDVVLNSLSGAAIQRGLEALAPGGRFVELGKRDIHDGLRLGLLPFARGLTLTAVDFDLLTRTRPALVGRILRDTVTDVAEGRLERLPHTAFPLERVTDAFRTMAAAGHIGKLVVTLDGEPPARAVVRPGTVPVARRDGAYVISGGLTGIGLETARRLARRGAGALVLNGRGPASPYALEVIQEIRGLGTRVDTVTGDIAAPGTAERLVAAATSDGLPLRGVVHSAAALDDAAVLQQDRDRLRHAWWPKAVGAWRLHTATRDADLDWWIGYSSTAALLGAAGQANYAAACAYLDGLAQWRRSRGLPALSVDWGPWEAVGGGQRLAGRGYRMLSPATGFAALETLIGEDRTRTGVLDFDPAEWFAAFPGAASSPLYERYAAGSAPAPGAPELPSRLAAAPPGPARRELLETAVSDQLRVVLRLGPTPIDPQAPLSTFGIDSLGALELRSRLETVLGITLPATLVWAHRTIAALADNLAQRLGLELDPPARRPAEAALPALADGDAELLAQILLAAGDGAADGTPEEHRR